MHDYVGHKIVGINIMTKAVAEFSFSLFKKKHDCALHSGKALEKEVKDTVISFWF